MLAEDPYLAEDAAGLVFLDIEEEAPVVDPRDGAATEAAVIEKGCGDVERAFEEAAAEVEMELAVGRHSGAPMETRGALARWDPMTSTLEMFGAAKVPHYNRSAIASMLGLPAAQVVLREGHVGGGFDIRGELYPEDVLVCLAARRLGRPVRWVEDRREHMTAANHSRDQVHCIRAAVGPDGRVLGVVDEFWLDQGAYVRTHAVTVADLTAALLPGPYVWPAYRVTGRVRLTNKTPWRHLPGPPAATRAASSGSGSWTRSPTGWGSNPAEVRRRNLIAADAMPYALGGRRAGNERGVRLGGLRGPARPGARLPRLRALVGRPGPAEGGGGGGRPRSGVLRGEERARPVRTG